MTKKVIKRVTYATEGILVERGGKQIMSMETRACRLWREPENEYL